MANADRPAGLVPTQYRNGSPWNGQARMYYIASDNGSAFAIGDPVDLSGSGDTNGVPGIVLATAGNNSGANMILGSVVGVLGNVYGSSAGNFNSPNTIVVPATKTQAYYVMVADDPNIVFTVQEDSVGGALTAADIGINIDLTSAANNGYISQWELDSSVKSTSANYQMKLWGLAQTSDNAFGTNAKWLCTINLHRFATGVTGV